MKKQDDLGRKTGAVSARVTRIKDLKKDPRFENLIRFTEEQLKALEELVVERGELHSPIFYWEEQHIIIDGYHYLGILEKHGGLSYTLKPISFANWKEAVHWVVRDNISRPSLRIQQKLDLAFECPELWEKRLQARKNQKHARKVPTGQKIDTFQTIAEAVGCSRALVANYDRILKSGKAKIIEQCRSGELSISTAYATLFPSAKHGNGKAENRGRKQRGKGNAEAKSGDEEQSNKGSVEAKSKDGEQSGKGGAEAKGSKGKAEGGDNSTKAGGEHKVQMVTEDANIFEECHETPAANGRNPRHIEFSPVGPIEICNKFKQANVPDGKIWVVLYRDKGAMHVITKTTDKKGGDICIKVDAFRCRIVPADEEGVAIYEAEPIRGTTHEEISEDEPVSKRAVG